MNFWEVFEPLTHMQDALAVIRAASFIEDALKFSLGSKFAELSLPINLLKGSGPFGTFSARAILARAIGILSKEDYDDVSIIRKVRNDCAHTFEEIDLASKKYNYKTMNLKAWKFWTDESDLKNRKKCGEHSKTRLLLTAAVIAKDLISPIGATRKLSPEEIRVAFERAFRSHSEE